MFFFIFFKILQDIKINYIKKITQNNENYKIKYISQHVIFL